MPWSSGPDRAAGDRWKGDETGALIFDPVCGCDGVTCGSECEAANAGMNIDYAGEC